MMWLSEQVLYRLARAFYSSELAHSDEMKQARSSPVAHRAYRQEQVGDSFAVPWIREFITPNLWVVLERKPLR